MLVLGVLLALVAFGGVMLFGAGSNGAKPATPQTVTVVVAAADIPLGATLAVSQLSQIEMNPADATDTYRDANAVVGQVVRHAVRQGEALRTTDFEASLGSAGTADVSSGLKSGNVAIAVVADGVTGVGGFLQPGDTVDVILADPVKIVINPADLPAANPGDASASGGDPFVKLGDVADNDSVKVLVQNVLVLGRGAVTVPDSTTSTGDGSSQVDPATGKPVGTSGIVILSVTPQQAEIIRFGQTADGATLALVLRSPKDTSAPDVTTDGITLRELVDKYGVLPPQIVNSDYP